MKKNNPITRRKLLKNSMLMSLAGTVAPWKLLAANNQQLDQSKRGVIAEENRKAGTSEWQLTYVRTNNHRSEIIEGYCSQTSVSAGDTLNIFVSTSQTSTVSINIYRMGYYGGKGGRHMGSYGPFLVEPQPTPPVGEHRLRDAHC